MTALCRQPLASIHSRPMPDAASDADMLVGPKHLIERHRQLQQQQQADSQESKPQLQQSTILVRPTATKQSTLVASSVRSAPNGQASQQKQIVVAAAKARVEARDENAVSQAKTAGKAQVAKSYIARLRTELPVATFRSAPVKCAVCSVTK